jgi:hypothetical protein
MKQHIPEDFFASPINWRSFVIMPKMMPPRDPDDQEEDDEEEEEEEEADETPHVREPDEN